MEVGDGLGIPDGEGDTDTVANDETERVGWGDGVAVVGTFGDGVAELIVLGGATTVSSVPEKLIAPIATVVTAIPPPISQ